MGPAATAAAGACLGEEGGARWRGRKGGRKGEREGGREEGGEEGRKEAREEGVGSGWPSPFRPQPYAPPHPRNRGKKKAKRGGPKSAQRKPYSADWQGGPPLPQQQLQYLQQPGLQYLQPLQQDQKLRELREQAQQVADNFKSTADADRTALSHILQLQS